MHKYFANYAQISFEARKLSGGEKGVGKGGEGQEGKEGRWGRTRYELRIKVRKMEERQKIIEIKRP